MLRRLRDLLRDAFLLDTFFLTLRRLRDALRLELRRLRDRLRDALRLELRRLRDAFFMRGAAVYGLTICPVCCICITIATCKSSFFILR